MTQEEISEAAKIHYFVDSISPEITELTIQESAKLIELGINPGLASSKYVGRWEHYSNGSFPDPDSVEPIFTLTDILSILPPATKDLGGIVFGFSVEQGTWAVEYDDCPDSCKYGEELIDALYALLVWCIEKGHVKL